MVPGIASSSGVDNSIASGDSGPTAKFKSMINWQRQKQQQSKYNWLASIWLTWDFQNNYGVHGYACSQDCAKFVLNVI